jgi:hypothetical protein
MLSVIMLNVVFFIVMLNDVFFIAMLSVVPHHRPLKRIYKTSHILGH